MTTITRERLLKIQQWRETYGPGSNVVLPAEEAEELARIALASLTAEPVFYIEVEGDDWTQAGRIPGSTFDNVILRGAYERAGKICPWLFWNDHDVRTLVNLGRSIGFDPKKDMPFIGDQHNALADARHQAKYVSAIWQKLIPATSTKI